MHPLPAPKPRPETCNPLPVDDEARRIADTAARRRAGK